ncbi:eCIS core domain-containing protein [Deinococcus arcticus]|uniref:eCIS core domain-containing protein n=1 Tax=Deinococcus arcticus TaxID=2136176 RepID=UPI001E5C3540|nr:DUF4157 domain-containing protein [Deinococcus arcticus]
MQRIQARRGAGNPLPESIRRHLEQGLNHDLSRVRIHDDAEADKLAKSVNAIAFATGADIFFQAGRFNPNTQSGLELLAHEVTHTVQQRQGRVAPGVDPDASLEAEAREKGQQLSQMAHPQTVVKAVTAVKHKSSPSSSGALQRVLNNSSIQPWNATLKGTLAGKGVNLSLRQQAGKIHGHYSYEGQAGKLTLEGELKQGQKTTLIERDNSGKITGLFKGIFSGSDKDLAFKGEWLTPDQRKRFGVDLMYGGTLPSVPANAKESKNYSGSIGDFAINMRLNFNKGKVSGYYYYATQGSSNKIQLHGLISGSNISLSAGQERFTAQLLGSLENLKGKWELGSKTLDFQVGIQNAAPQTGKINPKLIDELMLEIPKAMKFDPDRHGNSRLPVDFQKNPIYRQHVMLIIEQCIRSGVTDKAQIAYILITAAHESALGGIPREKLWGSNVTQAQEQRYFDNQYGPSGNDGARARRNGNTQEGDGYKYRGRGFVQLTWAANYKEWQERLTKKGVKSGGKPVDLLNDPDVVARDPKVAAIILVEGMRDGTFRKAYGPLGNYLGNGRLNFQGARNTVNGDLATSGVTMGRAGQALYKAIQNTPLTLGATTAPPTGSALSQKITTAALAGLQGASTVHIAYRCSRWTREVVTQHVDPNRTLFGGSALETYGRFRAAGLTRSYRGEGDLKPGDILFWDVPAQYWHVAIYVGGGNVAGNHYAIYLQKYRAIQANGGQFPGAIVDRVGSMPVYDGIDARGSLPLLKVAGKNPAAVATIPDGWKP